MTDASVVIATRDRAWALRGCLTNLAAQDSVGRFETVVVDNGSTDDTAEVIAAFSGSRVQRVAVGRPNRAKARNAGIAAASGRIVIFCDDDTLAPAHYVRAHLEAHARSPRCVVSGPIVNVADDQVLPAPDARHFSRAFLCTCNASVARADLIAVGGFDERYELYGWEDTDLGVRLRARGLCRAISAAAYLHHVKPPRRTTMVQRLELAAEKGAMAARFVRKSPTWPVRLATGAYRLNLARASLLYARPLRRLYRRLASAAKRRSNPAAVLAAHALIDAAYVDAMRAGLRGRHG